MKMSFEGVIGQILSVGLVLLTIMLVYGGVVEPLAALYDANKEQLDGRAALARRYQSLALELPRLEAGEKRWRDLWGGELLLGGTSDALASAALQSQLKSLIDANGARLASSEFLPAQPRGGFRRIGIRVVFVGELKLLASVLRAIDTARPVLVAGDFKIQSGSGGEASEPSGELSVTLDVFGFRAGR